MHFNHPWYFSINNQKRCHFKTFYPVVDAIFSFFPIHFCLIYTPGINRLGRIRIFLTGYTTLVYSDLCSGRSCRSFGPCCFRSSGFRSVRAFRLRSFVDNDINTLNVQCVKPVLRIRSKANFLGPWIRIFQDLISFNTRLKRQSLFKYES